jgi:hypothetical protein
MRLYEYFDNRYIKMKQDLRHINIPMPMKIKLLQEMEDTVVILKKVFQDSKKIDQRSLISSICKVVQASSAIKVTFLMKFLKNLPGYDINVDYITKNFKYLKNLATEDCSKIENKNIVIGVKLEDF